VDPHKFLNRWKNYFCQLLNAHGAGGTVELFVPEPSASEVEVAVGKPKGINLQVLIRCQLN
jgi:hypothetical protein